MSDLMSLETLEMEVLSLFWRCATQAVDRRADGSSKVNAATGLPESANDLAPRNKWRSGTELLFSSTFSPKRMAQSMLVRTAGEETALWFIPPHEWTPGENGAVDELTRRIKIVVRRLAQRGFVDERPSVGFDGEPLQFDDDGFALEFRATNKGLQEAKKRIRGTRYERGRVSIVEAVPPSMKSQIPQWARGLK